MQAKTEAETEMTHPDVWVNGIRYVPAYTPAAPAAAPTCDNCLFARGYSCCAHPTTIPFPSRRWCGEHQPRRT